MAYKYSNAELDNFFGTSHLLKKRARANSEALVANQTESSSLRDGESIKPRLHERFLSRASDAIFFRFSRVACAPGWLHL